MCEDSLKQQLEKRESDNAKSMLARADSYFGKGNLEKALACYKLARRLTKDGALLRGLYPKIARTHAALKQYDEAIDNYQGAIKHLSPHKHANILVEIGRLYQSSENYRQAVRRYREALNQSSQPDFVGDVLYWLGESLYKVPEIDENDDSLNLLEKAKSNPRNLVLIWEIHTTKGHALTQKQRFEEALEEFNRALNEDLDLIDIPGHIYNCKAECLEIMGKKEQAIKLYREAIHDSRSQRDTKGCAHLRIGFLLQDSNPNLAQKELEEAKKLFETAKNRREISERYADKYLHTVNKLLDDIEQKLESVKVAELSDIKNQLDKLGEVAADTKIIRYVQLPAVEDRLADFLDSSQTNQAILEETCRIILYSNLLLQNIDSALNDMLSEIQQDVRSWIVATEKSTKLTDKERETFLKELSKIVKMSSAGKILASVPLIPGFLQYQYELGVNIDWNKWLRKLRSIFKKG